MSQYRLNLALEAFQLPQLDEDVDAFHEWAARVEFDGYTSERDGCMAVETPAGTQIAEPGDWIVKGPSGEFYACKPQAFAETHVPVDAGQVTADYDRIVSICDAHGISLPVDCIEMVVEIVRHAMPSQATAAEVPTLKAPEGEDPMRYGDHSIEASVKRLTAAYCVQQPLPIPDQMALVWRFDIGRLRNDWLRLNAWQESARIERSAMPERKALIEEIAKLIEKKADDYATEFGHDDMGSLSFGQGAHADAKRDYHWSLIELAEEARAVFATTPGTRTAADGVQGETVTAWNDGVGLLWDVYDRRGKWFKRVISPIGWDAHAVHLHMCNAGYASHIEIRLVSASTNASPDAPASTVASANEPVIRFCPECGCLGEVPAGYEACCPDSSHARVVPQRFAELCAETFKLCVSQPFTSSATASTEHAADPDGVDA